MTRLGGPGLHGNDEELSSWDHLGNVRACCETAEQKWEEMGNLQGAKYEVSAV